ncbi:MAG: hypothetical protein RML72_01360 [Bacteroidia bacterium]|nr:hypothetical protein [Bacteroidia bacterium]MDW8157507.1 hypothetical protein [Bacteroidia bacterium]
MQIDTRKTPTNGQHIHIFHFANKSSSLEYRYPSSYHMELYNSSLPTSLYLVKFRTPLIKEEYLLYNQIKNYLF